MRLNIAVALVTLVAGLGLVAAGDRTSWSGGYGYDGRLYGDLAQHFPGAVFGDEGVTPPGYGKFTDHRPQGIDSYYVRRILPSAVVYYTLSALSIEKTHDNVIACFGVWNALIIALVAFLWCLCADRLGLGRPSKLLGLSALLVNFAVLKGAFYFPVLTDVFAFGFGAALLYFWLSRKTAVLAVVTFLSAFTWPTALLPGVILILFPRGHIPLARRPLSFGEDSRRATVLKLAAAAAPALVLLAYLVHLRANDYRPPEAIPLGGAFPLAVLAAATFVFAGLLWLVPDLGRSQWVDFARSLLSPRALLAGGLIVSVLLVQAAIADRPGFYDEAELLRSSLWYSALNPGLFAVATVAYFGPLLALAILDWPRVCRQLHSFGLGATLVAALFVVSCLLTEPRKLIFIYPFIVLFVVLGSEHMTTRRWFMPAFLAASLLMSRVWLPIGEFGLKSSAALRDFPAQRYFMSSGVWTSFDMYLVELAALGLLIVLFFLLGRNSLRDEGRATAAATPGFRP